MNPRRVGEVVALISAMTGQSTLRTHPDRGSEGSIAVRSDSTALQREMAGWLAAYNTGDTAVMRRFAAEHVDSASLLRGAPHQELLMAQLYPETRRLQDALVVYENAERIALLVRSELTDAWIRVTFRRAVEPPNKLVFLGFFISGAPDFASPSGRLPRDSIVVRAREYARRLAAAGIWSGAVAITDRVRTVFASEGDLFRERALPAEDAPLPLGTVSRLFVGIAACQLAASGTLALSAPVSRYVPDFPGPRFRDGATVAQVLTETSGIAVLRRESGSEALRGPSVLRYMPGDSTHFEPGDDVEHTDANTALLALIVEVVAHQPIEDYVQSKILQPARMSGTRMERRSSDTATTPLFRAGPWASGHMSPAELQPIVRTAWPSERLPLTGGVTTEGDLLRLARALLSGRLLGASFTQRYVNGTAAFLGTDEWPVGQPVCGFDVTTEGTRVLSRSATGPGFGVRLDIIPGRGLAAVTVANLGGPGNAYVANSIRSAIARDVAPPKIPVVGHVDTVRALQSKFLPRERSVRVFLPPDYQRSAGRRYPVLYLHDGQDVFGDGWRVDSIAQHEMAQKRLPPFIIVAVDNAGEYRWDEYTPSPVRGQGGQADSYGRMLVEEIKPLIDAHYRTLNDPAHTAVGGSSLGGLVSLQLGMHHPSVFGTVLAISPSVFWDNKLIVREVQGLTSRLPIRIWLDIGTAEGSSARTDVRQLRDALVEKGWSPGEDLVYREIKGASHHALAWSRRMEDILRFSASAW